MTTELFDVVSIRLKAIFTAHAALELEAEVIARHVERKAALLRQAVKLQEEGLKELADELRQHAGGLDPRRPAEGVLPMLTQAPTAPSQNNGQEPSPNATPVTTASPNGPTEVTAQIVASEPTAAGNGTCTSTLPEAIPAEPTSDIPNGRSTGRRKSR